MKQVWQTDDGSIFEREADAIGWETSQSLIDEISNFVWSNTSGIHDSDIREVVEFVCAHYNVTPK
jgi:hypothetical protein